MFSSFFGNWKKIPNRLKVLFFKNNKWIRIFIIFVFAGYCFHFVYTNLYHLQWSEDKKREYINTREKDIVFNALKMESVLSKVEKRREKYNSSVMEVTDIFQLNNYSE